jgi:acetate kinase
VHDAGIVLTVNGGSSSVKLAAFRPGDPPERLLSATVERIGRPEARLVSSVSGSETREVALDAPDHAACVEPLAREVDRALGGARVVVVGHRVVHGGERYREPAAATPEVLSELRRLIPLDPNHLPAEIGLIEAFARRFPDAAQVACFDTAFHRDLPDVAAAVPIPRRYAALGVRRYGFHGLSYEHLMRELGRLAGREAAAGRVVLAHLGNGASMAAVHRGRSVETTMGLTPASGLVMGTRAGDLDPGLPGYLARLEGMTPEGFDELVTARSGLLGVSGTSPDVRDLLEREDRDERAALALALFCHRARAWVGALAAALGGLETLVFAGGIGEHSPIMRERICRGLEFLGVALDDDANRRGADVISRAGAAVAVRVIPTDEERRIAELVQGTR